MILKMKYNLLTILLLFLSCTLIFLLESWMMIWMIMELNTLMFINFLILNNKYNYNSPIKYFLVNSFSSAIFISMIMLNLIFNSEIINNIIIMTMFIKLGMPPFHFWFMDMMNKNNWVTILILSTLQKLTPFFITINYIHYSKMNNFYFLYWMTCVAGLWSSLASINQSKLKMIMGYSSITHMSWMMMTLLSSNIMWLIYFLCYSLINFIIFFMTMKNVNIITLMDMIKILKKTYYVLWMFMSISSIPPLFGFLTKWMITIKCVNLYHFFILTILMIFSLIYLYYYMRSTYMSMMLNLNKPKIKFNHKKISLKKKKIMTILLSINMMGLSLIFIWLNI